MSPILGNYVIIRHRGDSSDIVDLMPPNRRNEDPPTSPFGTVPRTILSLTALCECAAQLLHAVNLQKTTALERLRAICFSMTTTCTDKMKFPGSPDVDSETIELDM
jgi:hypothetical protein